MAELDDETPQFGARLAQQTMMIREAQANRFPIGCRVEVRDSKDEDWAAGSVTSLMSDGRPRVQRDGDRPSYPYNEVRSLGPADNPKETMFERQLSADGTEEEFIARCLAKNLTRDLAKYTVEKHDNKFWVKVLGSAGEPAPHRASFARVVIDEVLPKSKRDEDQMSVVKAFKLCDLKAELLEVLDRMCLHSKDFTENSLRNRNLQNLLLLTCADLRDSKLMHYIDTLNHYDAAEIGGLLVEKGCFEEAHACYAKQAQRERVMADKVRLDMLAIEVLIANIQDLDRASNYAEFADHPQVWQRFAKVKHAATAKAKKKAAEGGL